MHAKLQLERTQSFFIPSLGKENQLTRGMAGLCPGPRSPLFRPSALFSVFLILLESQ